MPIFSDNAPRIKWYASSHQTLTVHGSGAGNKVMQYNTVEFNNGPANHFNTNGATGYASKPYSIQVAQNGQYLIEGSILANRTTTSGYIHCYIYTYDSSGNSVQTILANHDYDAGPQHAGWRHHRHHAIMSVPASGIVQINWYVYANVCSTYISHSGASYCYLQVTHVS
tara:strand:+ start:174 stop:680 length:507 start_codon:yes stop_codon:yes gene_type:complete